MFNYIITIHNKEDLLPKVLAGVAQSCSSDSVAYAVLDGCTDRSEAVVDEFSKRAEFSVRKVTTPDVHELRSLNAAFALVQQGYVICLQDDVVLEEPQFERKMADLYASTTERLGVVSPRHAMNVRRYPLWRQWRQRILRPLVDEYDRICHPGEAKSDIERREYGTLSFRMVAGGSPIVIPETVWKAIGRFDDAMAPYMWFDHEYSLRALKAGFRNALFPLKFHSKAEWGGMRSAAPSHYQEIFDDVVLRNRQYVWRLHGDLIRSYTKKHGSRNRDV